MIRRATLGDMDTLVELGRDMVHEAPEYEGLTFDEERLRSFLRWAIDGQGEGLGLIAEIPARGVSLATGTIIVYKSQWPFASETYVGDLALYVRKEHRAGGLAQSLLRRMEDWMREKGHTDVKLGISTGVHLERTALLYQLMGYYECGRSFRKRLTG